MISLSATIQALRDQEQTAPGYEFAWADPSTLLANLYPDVPSVQLIDHENSVVLHTIGGWLDTRGGSAEYAFLLDSAGCVMGIAETRDFERNCEDGASYPLWGNGRMLPRDHDLYNEIQTILTALRGGD